MKILSYNVNGIRAALNKDLDKWIEITDPDILCLQETKAMKEQVETSIFDQLGYKHYWFSAQKKGYSGVAILTKKTPNKITCLLYTSPSPRDTERSRMPSSA